MVSKRERNRLPGIRLSLQPLFIKHGRPVIKRLLQALQNRNWWYIGCYAPILLLASCGAKYIVATAGFRDFTP